ncbi:GPP34 family phosphoprotein [Streptomyces sp. MST-110588]|uniref:GOLPH3/VPS74 family protein n=1 Tax=Streptomyces sp. MST-110588 TaxID=2833628 RepID=UPI001F5DD7D9|nr:GPP34 family phosphoprotein [Streptomyces sp. MST-110588]UNO41286.1 GPP34 family phosphoprotein [Streptomyces sp. MST-110588]
MNAGGRPLTLPEELLLLALDPRRGRVLGHAAYVRYGLAGAALAELEGAGLVTGEPGGRIRVPGPLPPGDPVLDAAFATLPGPGKKRRPGSGGGGARGVRAAAWVRGAARTVEAAAWRQLEERGAVRREVRRALGLFPYERHPAGAVDLAGPARARFKAAVGAGFPGPRERLLAGLVAATDLDGKLLPGAAFRPVRREMKRLAREQWTARAVRDAVQRDKSADGGGG